MAFHTHSSSYSKKRPGFSAISKPPILQRACACGQHSHGAGECESCRQKRQGLQRKSAGLAVNTPGDRYEQEAERLALTVMRGSGGAGLGLQGRTGLHLQRQESPGGGKPPSEEEKYKEAAKKVGEAFLETEPGKKIKEGAKEAGEAFLGTLHGKIITGAAAVGAISYLAATNAELPMQVPEIPLDVVTQGLSMKLTYEGPVQKPTKAMISFTYKFGGGEEKKKPALTAADKRRAETARLQKELHEFREGLKSPEQRAAEEKAFWDAYWRMRGKDPLNPLNLPGLEPKKKEEEGRSLLMMRKEASTGGPAYATPLVGEVLHESGQPLDPGTRAFMEGRFGYDFSHVRLHTGDRAAESARQVNALAYTVGSQVVFGAGQFSPTSEAGRRLLAHELAHVVQQEGEASALHRQAAPGPAPAAGGLSQEMLRQIARRLRRAMAGLGTDEEAIYAALSGRTQEQVDAIASTYQVMYNRALIDDLRDELNESEMAHLGIFSPGAAPGAGGTAAEQAAGLAQMAARQLDQAMSGWGTDEEAIFATLTGRTQAEIDAIKRAYKERTGRELESDIRDEMSGTELTEALRLLGQGLLAPEDEIFLAISGLGTDEDTLFRVLTEISTSRKRVAYTIDSYAAKGYGDMLADIRDDLSGAELDRAMELLHGQTPSGSCSQEERDQGLEAVSGAVSMAQGASAALNADITRVQLSGRVSNVLEENFNPGKAPGAVTVPLARQVRTVLERTRTDLLMASALTCGAPPPCVAVPNCTSYTYGWTFAVPGATVRLCPAFFTCLGDERPRGMLHEFVHHTGVRDKFYRHDPGFSSLTPRGDQSATDSLDNADSFAHLAKQLR